MRDHGKRQGGGRASAHRSRPRRDPTINAPDLQKEAAKQKSKA